MVGRKSLTLNWTRPPGMSPLQAESLSPAVARPKHRALPTRHSAYATTSAALRLSSPTSTATGRENRDIEWRFPAADAVKLRLFNEPRSLHPMSHPIHLHGQRFLVLEKDGKPNANLVWKDTVIVPVGSTVDILVDMSNPGEWALHCHIAEHLGAGMMMTFTVEPLASVQ